VSYSFPAYSILEGICARGNMSPKWLVIPTSPTNMMPSSPPSSLTEVTAVSRRDGQTYVEIAAGSRDGVREGWTMAISRNRNFLANVRIISVDITRSTGILMLEDPRRGLVQAGDTATARAGVD
jgi:hypothetical protein